MWVEIEMNKKEHFILEEKPLCYISIEYNIVGIHLEPPEGFIGFIQAFWEYKPFKGERKRGIQYYSHLIIDGEDGRRYCPDVDYFVIKGKIKK